jgi:ubiquitin-conjugating enzyme E2 D/E
MGMTISLPSEGDLHKWNIVLSGPPGSLYAGGTYNLTLTLPPDYPFKAPQVNFATRIYHPNVTNDNVGNICLAILKAENWKPASRVRAVLEAVRQLLVEPNPDDPLEPRIADEFRSNRPEFEKNVKSYVSRYAKSSK